MNLESKFKKFALSMSHAENIDDLPQSLFESKRADYLFHERGIVVEVKTLTEDRGQTINQKLNELANSDPAFPQFFGSVHVEEIIRNHRESDRFRQYICNFAARTLDEIIRNANRQIADTRISLGISRGIGLLVLLNEGIQLYDDAFVYQEVSRILHKKKNGVLERQHIHAVWYINEYGSQSNQVSSSAFVGPTATNNHINSILNMFHTRWASHNGYALRRPSR